MDKNALPYLANIPKDPKSAIGVKYLYISNTKRYQIYSYLEGEKDEGGFDQKIVDRKLDCGKGVCMYGKSFGETPLDRSIEDYEEEKEDGTKEYVQKLKYPNSTAVI